jgi:putative transposase
MSRGFVYLFAILDWYSRRVLSWRLSNTLTTDFCLDALEEAVALYGCPDILNTDQGSQFTNAGIHWRSQKERNPDKYGWQGLLAG